MVEREGAQQIARPVQKFFVLREAVLSCTTILFGSGPLNRRAAFLAACWRQRPRVCFSLVMRGSGNKIQQSAAQELAKHVYA
jgi:hypothetical protein